MAPMTEITNTQDKVPMPASARKAVEARLAKGGSSTAISGEKPFILLRKVTQQKHLCCSLWFWLCTPIDGPLLQ